MGPYSANVVEPIMLFDELIRLDQGEVAADTSKFARRPGTGCTSIR